MGYIKNLSKEVAVLKDGISYLHTVIQNKTIKIIDQEHKLQQLDLKVSTIKTTLGVLQCTTNEILDELESLSTRVETIENKLGATNTLPQPKLSFSQNIKSNNDMIFEVFVRISELYNKIKNLIY